MNCIQQYLDASHLGLLQLMESCMNACRFWPSVQKIKEIAGGLGHVFTHLFQQSAYTGEIPKACFFFFFFFFFFFNICPLFKKGDKDLASYYCPVSLTCILYKVLEHTWYIQRSWITSRNGIFCLICNKLQRKHNCETQLVVNKMTWPKF